jgi:L-fucose isomerase-like protein
MATADGAWPKPHLNLQEEIRSYQSEFDKMKDQFSDVEFLVDQLVTSPQQVEEIKGKLKSVDGVLAIHLNIGIQPILTEILRAGRPTMVFAVPYSGHEWAEFGALQREETGAKMECLLTSDRKQLAATIRPFRAIHHLREAKVLNLTTESPAQYISEIRSKFGTEIKQIDLQRVRAAYDAVNDSEARAEADRWIQGAVKVVEPSREDIFKSCKLALAFEKLLAEEDATVMTVDCYGTMWDRTIKLPAYPCLGFARLNNLGWGGICESDLASAMTHIVFQGLAGEPGFISDPTMDESKNGIILAHCMGTPKMDGPDKPAAPYKLRTVMEREEGLVPQVSMRIGQKVTQAKLVGTDRLLYFTGEIIDAPETDRGCRTKITVKLDGDAEKLWKNWSAGLHRVTCYGDITKELEHFCRFEKITMVNEAA